MLVLPLCTIFLVNHLLYACSLDPFEDGILLDTPLVCIHRYCQNTMDEDEECEHKCTTTPSAREAWKRRRKKTQSERYYRLQAVLPPDVRYYRLPARRIGPEAHVSLSNLPLRGLDYK